MTLDPGTRLGPYEIVSPLGAGGMGEVYRARDPRLGRDVAVKVVRGEVAQSEEARRRFEDEARAVAALSHPNILSVHDIGSENGQVYIVMELLEGETLRERLERGPLPWRKAVEIAAAIADGLAAAHGKGIVHRDLKPANVFLTPDGRGKVLDFGLARVRRPAEPENSISPTEALIDAGRVVGTVGYMSPEQVAAQPVDPRSDIFSLGCVLHEMVSGQRAFGRPTGAETMTAILREEPPEVSDGPPELRRLVTHCLEKEPDARFQSARDLAYDLRAIVQSGASGSAAAMPGAPRRHRPLLLGFALGIGAAAAVALPVLVLQDRREPAPPVMAHVIAPRGTAGIDEAVVSPDGQRLALVVRSADGSTALWIRGLRTLSARPVAGTEGAAQPFWSPDSQHVAYFADGQIMRVDVAGGAPRVIGRWGVSPQGGSWSRNGDVLYAELGDPIRRITETGGPPSPATRLDRERGETRHAGPWFLPDGRHFLYFANAGPQATGIHGAALDSEDTTFIVRCGGEGPYASCGAVYDPSSGLLLLQSRTTLLAAPFDAEALRLEGEPTPVAEGVGGFSASATGLLAYSEVRPSQLTWVDRSGRDLGALPMSGTLDLPSLSHDGGRVAFNKRDPQTGNWDIWAYDLLRRVETRLTFDPAGDIFPLWSPDDQTVLFTSTREGVRGFHRVPASGGGREETVFESEIFKDASSWSDDGRHLVFNTGGGDPEQDLWSLSLPELELARLSNTPFKEWNGQLSPDARWLAYISDETERPEIYVQPFPPTGPRWRISSGGGVSARWRRDGRELYYLALDTPALMAVEVSASSTFEAGAPRLLFDLPPDSGGWYDVTADGQRFLIPRLVPGDGPTPVALVTSWPALLKK